MSLAMGLLGASVAGFGAEGNRESEARTLQYAGLQQGEDVPGVGGSVDRLEVVLGAEAVKFG